MLCGSPIADVINNVLGTNMKIRYPPHRYRHAHNSFAYRIVDSRTQKYFHFFICYLAGYGQVCGFSLCENLLWVKNKLYLLVVDM